MPLWGRRWESLDLDPALLERLARWQTVFDANFDPESGWQDEQTRDTWAVEGDRLTAALRLAVPDVEILADMWPLDADREV